MNCPNCALEMESGTANVTWDTLGGVLNLGGLVGSGTQQFLYFYPEGGGVECVFDGTAKAFRCKNCKSCVVAGK
jgi:hypothetical protein